MVDAVTIDAFAHIDGQPLAGLEATDFIVRDNGVEQRVDAVGTTDSAHVIIGLDLSGSVDGEVLQQLRHGVRAVTGQLTTRDRLSLFTFADQLRVLARAEVPDRQPRPHARADGSNGLDDPARRGGAGQHAGADRTTGPPSSCCSPTAKTRRAGRP